MGSITEAQEGFCDTGHQIEGRQSFRIGVLTDGAECFVCDGTRKYTTTTCDSSEL